MRSPPGDRRAEEEIMRLRKLLLLGAVAVSVVSVIGSSGVRIDHH
jgi:hypothetical protein